MRLLVRLAGDTVAIGEAIKLIGVADFRFALTDAVLIYLAFLDWFKVQTDHELFVDLGRVSNSPDLALALGCLRWLALLLRLDEL